MENLEKTVLIVEDERAIVEILKFNLKREGYGVLEALDGEAGLELAMHGDPDLILLDVMLPKMNGFDICKTLREAGKVTPIIMLTCLLYTSHSFCSGCTRSKTACRSACERPHKGQKHSP